MNRTSPKQITVAALTLIGLIILVFVGVRLVIQSSPKVSNDKLQIVASTNVWGDIAAQIGGDQVEVTSILSDSEADPHLYESDAQTASTVGQADLVISNGLGYDEFMDKLLAAAPSNNRSQLVVSEVLGSSESANPHLWYDLPQVPKVAQAMTARLSELNPEYADYYQQNLQTFLQNYQPVLDRLTQIKQLRAGQGAAYTERVAEYVLRATSMNDVTPSTFATAVESGSEPSPADLNQFQSLLESGRVVILQYNTQAVNDTTEQILASAKQANVRIVGVSETLLPGKNFQTWQLEQLGAYL